MEEINFFSPPMVVHPLGLSLSLSFLLISGASFTQRECQIPVTPPPPFLVILPPFIFLLTTSCRRFFSSNFSSGRLVAATLAPPKERFFLPPRDVLATPPFQLPPPVPLVPREGSLTNSVRGRSGISPHKDFFCTP